MGYLIKWRNIQCNKKTILKGGGGVYIYITKEGANYTQAPTQLYKVNKDTGKMYILCTKVYPITIREVVGLNV